MKKIIVSLLGLTLIFGLIRIVGATESWNLQGNYIIDFTCTSGCSGVYSHTMNITSMNLETGDFSGTGFYNADHSYTWNVSGKVTGSDVSFKIVYTGSNAGYTVDVIGTIKSDGSMFGNANSSYQTFSWLTTSGTAKFNRYAKITSPLEGEEVSGTVSFDATLNDKDKNDSVQWAIRKGTCAANTGTVWGNVDGHNDPYTWDHTYFHSSVNVSLWEPGDYCFVFNPTESTGDLAIRETRWFKVVIWGCTDSKADNYDPAATKDDGSCLYTPTDKDQCKKDGWKLFNNPTFKNQGDCVSYVQSNEHAIGNKNK